MVYYRNSQLDLIFSALSDSTRRTMLLRLADEEQSIAELASPFKISKSAVTKHIKVLENAGLLKRTVNGRVHRCKLEVEALHAASDWMAFYAKFWHSKLDSLDAFLKNTSKIEGKE
ncbi:MAG: DNA-binding transcriptional ArsR family regulator [Parasphingorhabdus sp.]|jgi:DNA-binding transcriptional ArsR family regulator